MIFLLECALYALGILLALRVSLFGIPLVMVWVRLLRQRLPTSLRHELLAPAEVPSDLQRLFTQAEIILAPLGFHYSHTVTLIGVREPDGAPRIVQRYFHPESRTMAAVGRTLQTEDILPFDVTFRTMFTNGNVLVTTDCFAHYFPAFPPWYDLHDNYTGSVEQQWRTHLDALLQVPADWERVNDSVEEYVTRENESLHGFAMYQHESGLILTTGDGSHGRYATGKAFAFAKRFVSGNARRMAALAAHREQVSEDLEAQVSADIAAFERWTNARSRHPFTGLFQSLLFLASVVAFCVAMELSWSWTIVPILLGVLVVHEAGHLIGMLMWGHRDRTIFLVPGIDMLLPRTEEKATAFHKVLVALLGPMPGLMGGFWALSYALDTGDTFWLEVGTLAVVLNGFNVLPFFPLDGGRVVEILFRPRFARRRVAFFLEGAMLFFFAASFFHFGVFVVVAVMAGAMLALRRQWGLAVRRVAHALEGSVDAANQRRAIFDVLAQPPFRQQMSAIRMQLAHDLTQHFAQQRPPRSTMIGGSLLYAACVGAPLLWFVSSGVLSRWMAEQGLSVPVNAESYAGAVACPVSREAAPWALADALPEQHRTLVGVFATAQHAQAAAQALQVTLHPDLVTVLGDVLFFSLFTDDTETTKRVAATIRTHEGAVLVEHPVQGKSISVSVSCEARDEASAARLVEDVDSYLKAPYGCYLRPPWLPTPEVPEARQHEEQRARSTHKLLADHTANIIYDPTYSALLREPMQPGWREEQLPDRNARLRAYHQAYTQGKIDELLKRDSAEIDTELVTAYHHHFQRDTLFTSEWIAEIGPRLGQVALRKGRPAGNAGNFLASGPHRQSMRHDGTRLAFERLQFDHPETGLPAFVSYLCERQCTDITYTLTPNMEASDEERDS